MKTTSQNKADQKDSQSDWQTIGENLVRYNPSGTYYARVRVKGKLIVRSLKTKVLSVAKLRKGDLEKSERVKAASQDAVATGKMTFKQALATFRTRMNGDPNMKPRSREYREERIAALIRTWQGIESMDVRQFTKNNCLDWAAKYRTTGNRGEPVSETNYNNTVGSLRLILDIAVESGAIYDNPARFIKRAKVQVKELALPTDANFEKVIAEIKHNKCKNLLRFLAYGGFRLREASNIRWADVDLDKGLITVRGDEKTRTKNGEIRRSPIIPDMRNLLTRLQIETPNRQPTDFVMQAKECHLSIKSACAKVGIPNFRHHDMRHYFITKCIECNVNPKVIAAWAGHKDGGVLILTRYAHVRPEHSNEMAQQVTFGKPANN